MGDSGQKKENMQQASLRQEPKDNIRSLAEASTENSPFPLSMYSVQIKTYHSTRLFLDLGRILQNAFGLQPPASFFQSPRLYPIATVSQHESFKVSLWFPESDGHSNQGNREDIRGVRLEHVCDASNNQAANESPVPDALPALLLVLLAGLDTKQPAGWGVVVVTVVRGAQVAPGREGLDVLGPSEQAPRAEHLRYWSSHHFEGCRGEWPLRKRTRRSAGRTGG